MPDRILGRPARITNDIPGRFGEPVTVSVIDPIGTEIVTDAAAEYVGDGRYALIIPPLTVSGVYEAVWDGTDRQFFTAGSLSPSALSKWDLRIAVANRIGFVHEGVVTGHSDGTVSDDTLLGGPRDYTGYWLVPGPMTGASGKAFIITNFDGKTLQLSRPIIPEVRDGDEYALFQDPPREIDNAIRAAIGELSKIARLPMHAAGIPVIDGYARIPLGMTYVTAVSQDRTRLDWDDWDVVPGRSLRADVSGTVDIHGIRDGSALVWEDSHLDTPTSATIAAAVASLHANRAGGQVTDLDEHLRRQIAADQVYERELKRTAGRAPSGGRRVIE